VNIRNYALMIDRRGSFPFICKTSQRLGLPKPAAENALYSNWCGLQETHIKAASINLTITIMQEYSGAKNRAGRIGCNGRFLHKIPIVTMLRERRS
jgi:hypothetical protein